MRLQHITTGASLSGIEPAQIVTVVATIPHGEDALQLIYRTPDGAMKERLLGRADEASISAATIERPFSFDGDGAAFQLTCEAKRIDFAFLFGPMMAVHTSNVDCPTKSLLFTNPCCRVSHCGSYLPTIPAQARQLWRASTSAS
jgi:hypothetical protein